MTKERSTLRLKKKKWYQILAPKEFNETVIGETPSLDPRLLIGKVITVNLMSLTRDIKKQNINMRFKVTGLTENKAETEVIGYQIMPTFIKRIIRRGRDNLYDSFVCETSDKKHIRLKPLIITLNKTRGVVINSLVKAIRINLIDYVRKISYKQLVSELVSYKLQINLKNSLRKIYPLRNFEIKEMILETEKKVIGKKEKVEPKEESDKAEVEEKKSQPEKEVEKEQPKEKEADKPNKEEKEVEEKKENNSKNTNK